MSKLPQNYWKRVNRLGLDYGKHFGFTSDILEYFRSFLLLLL